MPLAYGFWKYGAAEQKTALKMMETARELGIDHFDVADCYGNDGFGEVEGMLGRLRADALSLFDGAELATKVGVQPGAPYNSSKDYISRAVDQSLKRLAVERIDLLYIHRHDALTHPAELAETLDEIVTAGKAKAIGVSNYSPAQVQALNAFLKAPLAAHQVEFSAMHAEPIWDGVFDQAMTQEIKVYAWSPLAGGSLLDGDDQKAIRVRAALSDVAEKLGCSISAVALAFINMCPVGPTPIMGTKTPGRLSDAVDAMALALERSQWYGILEASLGRRLP